MSTKTIRFRFAKLMLVCTALGMLSGCGTLTGTRAKGGSGLNLKDDSAAYFRAGTQPPVVVLQAGHQDGKQSWQKLMPELTQAHMAIALDRPGHGGNPATMAPRDPCTIAEEQRTQLRSAGVSPPYVLVGHSLGGLYQYVYAKLYPEEVAGLVLLDPTHPKHWETMQKEYSIGADIVKLMRVLVFNSTDRAEFDSQATCLDKLDMGKPLKMPVRLLVSARFRPEEKGDYQKMLKSLRSDWLSLLGAQRMQTVWDAGHYIHQESPEEVLAAIDSLIADTRVR